MNNKKHLLVIDPTAFAGGSKIATNNILQLLNPQKIRITIITADNKSWSRSSLQEVRLIEAPWLARQEQGVPYFLRHLMIALQVLRVRVRYGKIHTALGASGPGVDLALYIAKTLLRYKIVQLVHGPVACSRTIGRCLRSADEVHYLQSSNKSLKNALSTVTPDDLSLNPPHFQILQNGLPANQWPSPCQTENPVIFWAASLLKWKGLDVLINALKCIPENIRPKTHICYIRPKETRLAVSLAPFTIASVQWHEEPTNLDKLRAKANIFVSTSNKEPFGLSILEAMAAGHCILIPKDEAFWDKQLIDGVNCIKYKPNNAVDLAEILLSLIHNMPRVTALGNAAAQKSKHFRAETCYASIVKSLESTSSILDTHKSQPTDTGHGL